MALTPEEQLELEEIRKQRQAIEAEQSSLNEQLAKLEQSQSSTTPDTDTPEKSEGFFTRIGAGIQDIVEPIVETGVESASAAGMAFGQGLTSDFADEASAKAISAATGRPYEEVLSEVRAEFEKAATESPVSTFLGGLGGGIAQSALLTGLTGGAGAPAAAANVASKIPSLSRLIYNVAKGLTVGASQGFVTGVGSSKKTIKEQRKEGFQEATEAAKRGAAFGGGLSAVGGTGKVLLSKGAQKVSKAIDEGKLPPAARLTRQSWRAGKEGKGYSGEAAKDKYADEAFRVAKEEIRPKIIETVTELRELRDAIVERSPGTVDISIPIKSLLSELKKISFQDAEMIRQTIKRNYETISEKGFVTLAEANRMAKFIRDTVYDRPELRGTIKEASYTAVNDIKNLVRDRIPTATAVAAIAEDPILLKNYQKYVSKIADEDLASMISSKTQMKPKEALQKAKEVKNLFKTMTETFKDEDPEAVTSLIMDPVNKDLMTQILRLENPIRILDSKMKKILDTSEILGGVTLGKSESEIIDDALKIFTNLVTQPKDSTSAYVAKKKYELAMNSLKEAVPELEEVIQKQVKPVLEDLELQRYIEGAGFDQSIKESGLLKKLAGDIFRTGAQATNITAQTISAARKGEAGPIAGIPTTTLIKPGVSTLASLKKKIDEKLTENPNNKVYQMFSEMINNAIENQDEGRKIAVVNTLLQYESIRNMLGEEKN